MTADRVVLYSHVFHIPMSTFGSGELFTSRSWVLADGSGCLEESIVEWWKVGKRLYGVQIERQIVGESASKFRQRSQLRVQYELVRCCLVYVLFGSSTRFGRCDYYSSNRCWSWSRRTGLVVVQVCQSCGIVKHAQGAERTKWDSLRMRGRSG